MNALRTDRAGRPLRAYPLVALAVVLFSFSPILVRFASDAPGVSVATLRTIFAALIVCPPALFRARAEMKSFVFRDWLLITVAGILLAGHFILWIEALYFTTVASASVFVASSPIILAILGYFVLKERLSPLVLVAVVAGVFGAALIGMGDREAAESVVRNPTLGNALAVTAAGLFSIYFIIGRIVRQKTSWLAYVGPLYLVVALTSVVVAITRGAPLLGFQPRVYLLCIVMAIGPQIVGHGSFNYAVKYFSPTLLGLFGLMEPIGATLFAFLFFAEIPVPLSFLGAAILLISVAAAMIASDRKARAK